MLSQVGKSFPHIFGGLKNVCFNRFEPSYLVSGVEQDGSLYEVYHEVTFL